MRERGERQHHKPDRKGMQWFINVRRRKESAVFEANHQPWNGDTQGNAEAYQQHRKR